MCLATTKPVARVLRSTLSYAPAILLTRVSALLMLVIATRLISQEEFGLLTLVVTVGELTDLALASWLRISLLRLGGKGEISRGSVLLAARVLALTTVLGLGVAAAASLLVAPERWAEFSLAVGAYLIVGAMSRFALVLVQLQQRHFAYSMLELGRAVLQLVLPVAAIWLLADSFLMVSLASSLAVLASGFAALYLASGRVIAGPPRFTQRELLAFGIPLIVMAIVGFGLNSAERVLLKLYYDAGAVAIFAAAFALARQPIDTVANAINMGAFPEMVSRFDQEGAAAAGRYLSRQMALMAQLCLPIAATLAVLGGDFSAVLLPAEYHEHTGKLFPLIALSVLFTNFASFGFENVFHAHKKPWLLIVSMTPGAIATIVLSILLIPHFAELGAASALAGGSCVNLLTSMVLSRRLTRIPLPYAELGQSAAVALACGLAAWVGSSALGDMWPLFKLAAGGGAGILAFAGLQALLHPDETRAVAQMLRAKVGIA
ncbi:MAG TPA: lipopolysaccharide biosynthesis protein [Devosiaceae bacterium]|nr:lipopolysaccharide biosynthesis protein [Devosiaceae bacterium]